MTDEEARPEALTDDQRAELEGRLADLQAQLAELAQDGMRWPDGPPPTLQDRSAELELHADAIRRRLGMPPALGRPPGRSWIGWMVLCAAVVAIVAVIFLVTR